MPQLEDPAQHRGWALRRARVSAGEKRQLIWELLWESRLSNRCTYSFWEDTFAENFRVKEWHARIRRHCCFERWPVIDSPHPPRPKQRHPNSACSRPTALRATRSRRSTASNHAGHRPRLDRATTSPRLGAPRRTGSEGRHRWTRSTRR
eukprot:1191515-Prorocentrum_minimum.AAC.2